MSPANMDYSVYTVTELKALAKDYHIRGYSKMKKAELLQAMQEYENRPENDTDVSSMTKEELVEHAKSLGIKTTTTMKKDHLIGLITQGHQVVDTEREKRMLATIHNPTPVERDMSITWQEHLEKHGWTTVPLEGWDPSYVDRMYDHFEACNSNFSRDDQSTWTGENLPYLIHGIMKHHFGHTQLQWDVRKLCHSTFTELCDTEELLCSFDGGCLLWPGKKSKGHWLHVDQPRDYGVRCYQGIVNFLECGPDNGGLVLLEGSRDVFDDYMASHPGAGYKWEHADLSYAGFDGMECIKICARAGELILFQGEMFHCNCPPKEGVRMCTYVSMQPRSLANEKLLEKRQKLYEQGRMTGHWCVGPYFGANAKDPRQLYKNAYENQPDKIEIAPLDDEIRAMVGY